jgi:hypothetical protein
MGDRIKVAGFVEKVFVKDGNSAKGPWRAYSIKLQRVSGDVDPRFYQFGFADRQGDGFVPFFMKEGEYVQFEADIKDDKAATFVKGSGSKPKNPPAKPAAPAKPAGQGGGNGYAGKGGGGGGYKPRPPVESKLFGKIGGNNTEDDIRRMSYTAARSAAVETVALLLANEALPMSAAKTKAGEAKRYEEIVAAVDKLTVKFFFDAAGGRLLQSVADEGTKETRVATLPDAQPGKPAASTETGTEPPADPDGDSDPIDDGSQPSDDGDGAETF